MNKIFNSKNTGILKIILTLVISALFVIYFSEVIEIIKNIYNIISPLILGAIIAYILNLLVVKYEKIYFPNSKKRFVVKTKRPVSIILSFLTVGFLAAFIISMVVPQFIQSIKVIFQQFPVMIDKVIGWAKSNSKLFPGLLDGIDLSGIDGFGTFEKVAGSVLSWAGSGFSLIGSVAGSVVKFIISLIFSLYILGGKEKLKIQIDKLLLVLLKPNRMEKLNKILKLTNKTFSNYIIGQCTEAIILGVLCTVGMFILKFPYAAMIGSVMGITALIPMIGAYIGAAVGAFMILMVNPMKAVLFIVFIIILQQFEGNVIYPRVVGSKVGLPGIWVLVAVTIGGGLFGVPGVLFGVPVAATFYHLISEYVNHNLCLSEKSADGEQSKATINPMMNISITTYQEDENGI